MGFALKIDIEKELEAIERGECASCRIGVTHLPDKPCYFPGHYMPMKHCPKCNHMFSSIHFEKCPVCN